MEHEKGLLEGIVILDLTRVLAGPYCGALLADMGATVIKVEQPGKGDDSRSMGPFINDQSVYFANFNRSKMGVTLNLKAPEAKEIFKEMVKKADVVIENYRPGTMEKLGLGYDVLKEINPGIIYGACSGFGHTGPYSKRAGYDIVGQAMGGLMSTTGWPGGPATRCGTPMGDVLGGLNLTVGVLAALVNKQRTGLGEKVDVALVDSVASAMENITMIYQSTGRIPQRIGNRYESTYPYDVFPASDGDVVIAAGNAKLWKILCSVMGSPELADAPKFAGIQERIANHEELREIIDRTEHREKLGVCLDTCHVNDAGYDIVHDLDGVLTQFDKVIGLERLKAVHVNDSKNPLGAHKDRHEKIGEGTLGLDAIVHVMTHPALREKPFYLETPNDLAGYAHEIALLRERCE